MCVQYLLVDLLCVSLWLSLQQLDVVGDFSSFFTTVYSMCVCVCVSFVAASHRGVCVAVSVCGGVDLHPLKIELGWREGGASHVERWTQCSNTAASLLFPQLKVITSPLCPHCTSESPRLTVHRVTDLMFYVHCVMWEHLYKLSFLSQLSTAAKANSVTLLNYVFLNLRCVCHLRVVHQPSTLVLLSLWRQHSIVSPCRENCPPSPMRGVRS